MICNRCGQEYFGESCPYCEAEVALSPETEDNFETQRGVHSDTVRNLFEEKALETPPPSVSQWQQVGESSVGNPNPQQGFQQMWPQNCPLCGKPLNARFCGSCGYDSMGACGLHGSHKNSFTERYENSFREPQYRHKMSPWVIVLIVGAILFSVILPSVAMVDFWMHGEEYIEQFMQDYMEEYEQLMPGNDIPGDTIPGNQEDNPDASSDSSANEMEDVGESLLPNGVSRAEYRQIQKGMTYAEISSIIGGDAPDIRENPENENELAAYWPGEYNTDAVVMIVFEDSVATEISEEGLFE